MASTSDTLTDISTISTLNLSTQVENDDTSNNDIKVNIPNKKTAETLKAKYAFYIL